MARRAASEATKAVVFLNITLRDEQTGEMFTVGGKALPTTDYPRGNSLPCRIVRKLWQSAEQMPTGDFPFPSHGSFMEFCRANGISINLSVRRTDDETSSVDDDDDIEF